MNPSSSSTSNPPHSLAMPSPGSKAQKRRFLGPFFGRVKTNQLTNTEKRKGASKSETSVLADKKIQDERKVSTQAKDDFLPIIKLLRKINVKTVDNDDAKKMWKEVANEYRIIMSPDDYFNLTGGSDNYGNININNKPYSVITHDHLKRGQIMIPDVYKDALPLNDELELSLMPENPIDINSIIVTVCEPASSPIKSKNPTHAALDESDETSEIVSITGAQENSELKMEATQNSKAPTSLEPDSALTLSKDGLEKVVGKILSNKFVVEIGKQYPLYILHDRSYKNHDDPIKNGTSESLPRKIHLSFSPSDHQLQALLNDKKLRSNPEFSKEQITKATRFISTDGYSRKLIFPSEGYRYFKPLMPEEKLMSDKAMRYHICPKLCGDNRIHISAILLRAMASDQYFEDTRFLVKIGKYYYYTAAHNCWGEENYHALTAQTNLSFQANYPLGDFPCMAQSDKELTHAKNITIDLNWLSGDRKQLSLQEDMTTYVRKALEQVPLQKGRVFQVPVVLLDQSQRHRFVLEATVTEVSDDTVNATSSAERDSEPLFICVQESTLNLTAQEACILDGSAPAAATMEYYMEQLTSGLAGVKRYARKLVDEVIFSREKYEKGETDHYNKGVLFYGPKGNGKSELAVKLFLTINSQEVECHKHIIKPGSIIGLTAEATTKNLEAMFKTARSDQEQYEKKNKNLRDKGHKAPLHVYLIDEIDGFIPLKKDEPTPVENALNTYLKTILSSPQALNNIIIIGTTNSTPKRFQGPLTRTGRFSVNIHMDNPDEVQRLDIMEYFISKSTPPTAFIDEDTKKMAAQITMNRSAIDIKSLIEEATGLASKSSVKKIEMSHIYEVLHPKDQVALKKREALKTLEGQYSTYRDSVVFEQEEQALSSLSEKISLVQEVPGRHQLFFVEGDKNSRTARFCHDLLEKSNNIYGYDVVSSLYGTISSFSESIDSHRSVIVLSNVNKLIKYYTEILHEPQKLKEIGRNWDEVRLSKTSSTAFILPIPVGKIDAVKSALGIDHKYYDTCTLPDRFSKDEMTQLLKKDYPNASNDTVMEVVELFGSSFPIKPFKELIHNYFYKKGQSTYWHTERIQEKLEIPNTTPNGHLYL